MEVAAWMGNLASGTGHVHTHSSVMVVGSLVADDGHNPAGKRRLPTSCSGMAHALSAWMTNGCALVETNVVSSLVPYYQLLTSGQKLLISGLWNTVGVLKDSRT
jgi:hypothetical protein